MLLTKRKASSLVHGGRYIEGTVVGDEVGNTVGNAVGNLVGDDVGLGVLGLGVGISTTITSVGIGVGASPQRLHVAAHFSLMPTPSTVMLSQNFPRRASFLLNQVQDLACPMSLRNRKLESSLHGSCVGSAVEEGAGVGFLPFPLLGVEHLPFPFPVLVDVQFEGAEVGYFPLPLLGVEHLPFPVIDDVHFVGCVTFVVGIGVDASPQRLHVAAHFSLMPTPSTVMLSQNFPRRASFLLNQVQDLACPMSLRNRKLESSLHGSCVGCAAVEGAEVEFLPFPLLGVEHLPFPFPFPVLVDVHFAGFAVAFSGGLRVDSATGIVVVGDRLDASTRQRLQDSAHTIPILVPSDAILPQYFDCLASFSFSQWHPFRSPMLLRKRKLMSLPQGSPVVSVLDEVGIDVEYSICLFDEMLFLGIS